MHTGESGLAWNTALTVHVRSDNRIVSSVTVSSPHGDTARGLLYPDFLRKRAIPDRHMAVPREVDNGIITDSGKVREGINASRGDLVALRKMKSAKRSEKSEAWNKLAELPLCALSGLVIFEAKLGTATYRREKKSCIIRQGHTDKDLLWEGAQSAYFAQVCSLWCVAQLGTLSESTARDDSILLGDCTPRKLES